MKMTINLLQVEEIYFKLVKIEAESGNYSTLFYKAIQLLEDTPLFYQSIPYAVPDLTVKQCSKRRLRNLPLQINSSICGLKQWQRYRKNSPNFILKILCLNPTTMRVSDQFHHIKAESQAIAFPVLIIS